MKPKVGDYIRIKSKEHWNIKSYDEIYVDGKGFQSQFDHALKMKEKLGCVLKVQGITEVYVEDKDEMYWDYHSIAEILSIEDYPELYL